MKTLLEFSIAGALGFVTDYVVFLILSQWISIHIAKPISFLLAVNVTYLINKYLAFKDKQARYGWYLFGQTKGFLLNFAIFEVLLIMLVHVEYGHHAAFIVAAAITLIFNFTYARYLAFR